MNNPLDLGSTLSAGWETFSKNAVALILGLLLVGLVGGISLGICAGPMLLGYCRMVLRAHRGEQPKAGDVFAGLENFGSAFVLMLLVGVCVVVGFIFLVIPGLIAAYLFYWSFWFMADGEDSPTECMRKSSALARGDLGSGVVFVLVNGLISGAGNAVPFGGLLTGPVAMAMAGCGFDRATRGMQPSATAGHDPHDPYGQQQMQVQQQPYGGPPQQQ